MRIKNNLVLREIAGQYIIVPIMERVKDVPSMIYISSSAAYLWGEIQDKEVSVEYMVDLVMKKYKNVTPEQAKKDILSFINVLERNNIIDYGGEV